MGCLNEEIAPVLQYQPADHIFLNTFIAEAIRMMRTCFFIFLSVVLSPVFALSDSLTNDSAYVVIQKIRLTGNKTTRPHIVFRELTFSTGDTMPVCDLKKKTERSRQNLLNTSLFNFVTITSTVVDSNKIAVDISMAERWYLFPVPIFEIAERNFNVWWETKNLARANYGFYVIKENFRGRKESLTLRVRLGYSEQYGFSYVIPYIDKKQKSGLNISSYFYRGHEIIYKTFNNRPVFFKAPDDYIRREFVSRIAYTYRRGLYNTHALNFRHNKASIADTVEELNSDYFRNHDKEINFFSASYFFRRDTRDSRIYPLRGNYFDFEIAKSGLHLIKNESVDIVNLSASFKKYWKPGNRVYIASSVKGKYSGSAWQPYYVQRALGYGDYVRGYEYYVMDGSGYGLLKTGIKYELVKPHIQKIPYLNMEKFDTFHYAFYIELFSDAAYVHNKMTHQVNNLTNTFLFGTGIGIDFVTYYDNVFRMEYSFNKKGEYGIFLHISAPI